MTHQLRRMKSGKTMKESMTPKRMLATGCLVAARFTGTCATADL